MNQNQRNFLVDKITSTAEARISELQKTLPEKPRLNLYLFHAIMSGTLKLKDSMDLLELVRQKALDAKGGDNWMDSADRWTEGLDIRFKALDLFEMPSEYKIKKEEYDKVKTDIDSKVKSIRLELDTLITRVKLSSDKILQGIIADVDNIGDLKLIDTKIKALNQ